MNHAPPQPSRDGSASRGFMDDLARLGLLLSLEKRVLAILVSYAVAIGLFSLIIPLTVQELTNTFAYAIEPIMIVTFALVMLVGLLFIGLFRVLQNSASETIFQRLYVRIALAMTEHLPRIRQEAFLPKQAFRFVEAELLTRAVLVVLVDVINVLVSGLTGMAILAFYHPNYLLYNIFLLGGFVLVAVASGQGGVLATKTVSDKNYDVMNWIQEIANNRLHFKASLSAPFLIEKTDRLLDEYLAARRARANILTWRQYRSIVVWEAVCHTAPEFRYGDPPDLCVYLYPKFTRRTGSRLCAAEARCVQRRSQHPSAGSHAVRHPSPMQRSRVRLSPLPTSLRARHGRSRSRGKVGSPRAIQHAEVDVGTRARRSLSANLRCRSV